MTPDRELLQHYAATNSEDAFAEVVRRHVNLVYSAALRQVNGDAHLAHDVAQTVFTDLARKAGALARHESLTGWLYTSAHFAAAKIIRGENRRRDREEKFMREPTNNSGMGSLPVHSAPDPDWEKLRPTIDDAMHELKTVDREAVLLRYFENRPFAEVGAKLGLNENAARMRVERAVEKLRGILTKRGIGTIAALATVISANAVQTAPVGLAATLTTTSLTTAGTLTLAKIITTMKLKLIFSALVVASAATALVMQHQAQTKLAGENESLRQQISQLQTDNEGLSNRVVRISKASPTPVSAPNNQNAELLKLRGEVGVLHQQMDEANQKAKTAEQEVAAVLSAQVKFTASESKTINAMKLLGLDVFLYAGDNNGQLPTNSLYKLAEANDQTNLLKDIPAIEYINANIVTLDPKGKFDHPNLVIMLERIARQSPDGTWHRLYGFADGSVQTAISQDGNFDAWEKANTYTPPLSQ
jgi:RNA polymerase sigma factor (sigma-70 family)